MKASAGPLCEAEFGAAVHPDTLLLAPRRELCPGVVPLVKDGSHTLALEPAMKASKLVAAAKGVIILE